MLKMSREADLALLLMAELARQGRRESLGLLSWAEERGLPYRFLSKVAVKLKKAGLVKSKEGREGGYSLARKAKKIKVGEILEVIEGPVAPVKCLCGGRCGLEDWCGHKSLMGKLARLVEKQLDRVSLAEIC